MYNEYFKLKENPFAITPDPAYLYLSAIHQEALGHLLYGTGEESGFVLLTGEVGTGKTTLIRALLEQDMPDVDVALVLNPRLTVTELLATLCDELHIKHPRNAGNKQLVDLLNAHLLKVHGEGRHTVLIIDEAQNLSHDVLEQVRLLTNLETSREKLLRIMLVGQPELQDMLGQKKLRQLSQRITARYHLQPLSLKEVEAYVLHRLSVAGGRSSLFSKAALRSVFRLSRGIPRLVNIVCDRALLGAYAEDVEQVSATIVRKAAVEAFGNTHGTGANSRQSRFAIAAVAGVALLAGIVILSLPKTAPELVSESVSEVGAQAVALEQAGVATVEATEAAAAQLPVAAEASSLTVTQRLFGTQPTDRLMDRLVALWSTSPPPAGVSPCAWLKSNVSLHCYQSKVNFDTWRQFNRPSILRLKLEDGSLRHVLVSSADSSGVEVSTSNGEYSLDRDWLDSHWTGDFLLLWEPPMGQTIIPGNTASPAGQWLSSRLKELGFDSVSSFQASHGLSPDGVAGARTLLTLLANAEGKAPRLVSIALDPEDDVIEAMGAN